jgi:hypothetical protein
MSYSYAEKWSRSYKEAIKPLTEAEARKRHEKKGALYTVLLGDSARPSTIIEIVSLDSIQVEYYDESLRRVGYYQFVIQSNGQLFMVAAGFNQFDGDNRMPIWSRRLSFKPDGHVMSFEEDHVRDPGMETVVEKTVDVSLNWEPYPAFGDYASIARIDRDKPAAEQAGFAG